MNRGTIRNIIKAELQDENVYRTDSFLNGSINRAYQLTAVLSLFDERRVGLSVTGSRNLVAIPSSGNAQCIAPMYIANTSDGSRVNPVGIEQMEFYNTAWEGRVEGTAQYYTLLSPFHYAWSRLVMCPAQNLTTSAYILVGAFEPVAMSADTDEPRLAEEFQGTLIKYVVFECLVSEPGRAKDALRVYKQYIEQLDELVRSIKSRFPGGRDFEPYSTEFTYDLITEQQTKPTKTEKPEE